MRKTAQIIKRQRWHYFRVEKSQKISLVPHVCKKLDHVMQADVHACHLRFGSNMLLLLIHVVRRRPALFDPSPNLDCLRILVLNARHIQIKMRLPLPESNSYETRARHGRSFGLTESDCSFEIGTGSSRCTTGVTGISSVRDPLRDVVKSKQDY